MSKSYFFYGVVEGEIPEDTWQALHEHFSKLTKEDTEVGYTSSDRKSVKQGSRN